MGHCVGRFGRTQTGTETGRGPARNSAIGLDPMRGLLKSIERNEIGSLLLKGRVLNGVAGSCLRIG
jgi:hypothetical protein